jgi:rubrerythrin
MRVSNTPRRHSRSRNNPGRRNNNSPNNPYDSNKDNKIKGNAIQVHERYQSMARDAVSSGDIVKAEYYFQHAEHYHRIHKLALNSQLERQQQNEKNIVPINKEEDNKQSLEKNKQSLEENNISEKISGASLSKENEKQPLKKNNIKKFNSEKVSDTLIKKEDDINT